MLQYWIHHEVLVCIVCLIIYCHLLQVAWAVIFVFGQLDHICHNVCGQRSLRINCVCWTIVWWRGHMLALVELHEVRRVAGQLGGQA